MSNTDNVFTFKFDIKLIHNNFIIYKFTIQIYNNKYTIC